VAIDTPKVVFIDDSATMREVIKIAFRRENIDVVAYTDGNTALDSMAESQPDVVITDVIMPNKDGYEVCQFIKQHPQLSRIPVILMSGVVNRSVAEKAFAVKADELIRKPFQPQDLITRVKHLLQPVPAAPEPQAAMNAAAALSSIFAQPNGPAARPRSAPVVSMPSPQTGVFPAAPMPSAAAGIFQAASSAGVAGVSTASAPPMRPQPPQVAPPVAAAPAAPMVQAPSAPIAAARTLPPIAAPTSSIANAVGSGATDVQKWRVEAMRLEGLVKKLQVELAAERDYVKALEAHIKTLQDAE